MTRTRVLGMLQAVSRAPRFAFCLLLAAPFAGCAGGTETGNPSFQAELSYTAYSSRPLEIGVRDAGTRAEVDNAWLDLDAVALVGAGTCGSGAPDLQTVPALGIGDHASGKHNLTRFELAAGSYCALDLPFVRVPKSDVGVSGQPAELAQHSVMIAGKLADGTRFSILSSATPIVHLSADAGSFEISPEQAHTLIAFDVAAWLETLDWPSAERAGGEIMISEASNPALLAPFEAALARGVALYRDEDGDGRLDAAPVRLAHSAD